MDIDGERPFPVEPHKRMLLVREFNFPFTVQRDRPVFGGDREFTPGGSGSTEWIGIRLINPGAIGADNQ